VVIAVADTHAAIWHLFDDERLSLAAAGFINTAATARQKIGISSITLAELLYLVEKQRLPTNAYLLLRAAIANPEHVFEEIPLTNKVVDAMRSIPRNAVPDLPDRIIAATALQLDVPVMSCDSRIRQSGLRIIW
jgi:PIN domain nuclease of toxin-antitoxin system